MTLEPGEEEEETARQRGALREHSRLETPRPEPVFWALNSPDFFLFTLLSRGAGPQTGLWDLELLLPHSLSLSFPILPMKSLDFISEHPPQVHLLLAYVTGH